MKIKHGETTLRINVSFAAVVTLMLILDESGLCALSLFCCAVHEVGHIICLMLLGEKPVLLELSFYGIKLERRGETGSGIDDILVFLSGPAMNLIMSALLLCFFRGNEALKTAAAVSSAIGCFNLIPCRPLDGGNIVYALLCRHMREEKAERISFAVSAAVIAPMGMIGFAFALRYGNFTLALAAVYLAAISFLNKKEKGGIKL